MITVYPYEQLGSADHGWLQARHHFSFANYYNPERLGFGCLRVINDDVIAPQQGFPAHPHSDMEIITYVRAGAITHRDSKGNSGRTEAGDVQVMSAGSGITHSEYNLESVTTNIYQIWIEPDRLGVKPSWDAHAFPKQASQDALTLLVAGDGSAPLQINQDAYIYAGNLAASSELNQPIRGQAYLLVSEGKIKLDEHSVKKGDGAEIVGSKSIRIRALEASKILVIDLPS